MVAAIELARAGQSVTVIEFSHVGGGATGSSMGVLSTPAAGAGFGDPDEVVHGRARKAWHRDRLAAQRYLLRLVKESAYDVDLQQGVVLLAPNETNLNLLEGTVKSRNQFYGTHDYVLSSEELEQEGGGNVSKEFAGGLVMSEAHHVHPAKLILGLASLARSLGVTICERTEVTDVQATKSGSRVTTNGGNLTAKDVLLATGGYTPEVFRFLWERTLGVPSIVVASEDYRREDVQSLFPSERVLLVNKHCGYNCRPSPDGRRILLGGPLAKVRGSIDANVDVLRNYFSRLFPEVAHMEFTHCWTGSIAATRDSIGHSGAHQNTWYSVGNSGLVSCADAGRRMAQNILHADESAATADARFVRWPLRHSEPLLWRSIEYSTRLLDRFGKSRLR